MEEERIGWRDAWLPALLVVLGVAELASLGTHGWRVAVGLQAVAGVLLVFRRRYPLAVGPASSAVLLVIPWIGPQLDEAATPILFFILAIFSLARWTRTCAAWRVSSRSWASSSSTTPSSTCGTTT